MKVYVVQSGEYDYYGVDLVAVSPEAAFSALQRQCATNALKHSSNPTYVDWKMERGVRNPGSSEYERNYIEISAVNPDSYRGPEHRETWDVGEYELNAT